MTLSEVQRDVIALSAAKRRKPAAFLTALRVEDTGEWEQAAQLGGTDCTGRVSPEDAKQCLPGGN